MKRIMLIAACLAAVLMLSACVPTEKTEVMIAPEVQEGPVEYNFDQIHNDVLTQFEGYGMYAFVIDLDISGDNTNRMVSVTAVVPADMEESVLKVFAAAVLRRINNAAMYQDYTLTESTALNMGDIWKNYGCRISFYAAKEDGSQGDLIKEYSFNAGEDIGLNPDVESYEEEWLRELEILKRNAE